MLSPNLIAETPKNSSGVVQCIAGTSHDGKMLLRMHETIPRIVSCILRSILLDHGRRVGPSRRLVATIIMSTITPLVVGGIPVDVYRYPSDIDSSSPIYALFVLHGRSQSTKDVEFIINAILDYNHGQMAFHKNRDLIVLAFVRRTVRVTFLAQVNWHRRTIAITEDD